MLTLFVKISKSSLSYRFTIQIQLYIDNLKCEMPMYAAEAEDVSSQIDRTDWWGKKANKLPEWSNACRKALLLQLSSAASERVFFSVLSNSFSNRQEGSLRDYIHTDLCYGSV